MQNLAFLDKLYKYIDSHNSLGIIEFLTDDAEFLFANMPPAKGKENILAFLENFFKSIKGISHAVEKRFETDGHLISSGHVTYTRHNGTNLSVKFCNIFKMRGQLIEHYDIFIDASTLYGE